MITYPRLTAVIAGLAFSLVCSIVVVATQASAADGGADSPSSAGPLAA